MKKLMMAVACVALATMAMAETIDVTAANFGTNDRTLQNGNTYRFAQSIDFAAPVTESALKVADGADVTLVIPAGVTVTLRGGDASGTTGAGAGIEVPEASFLRILGEGTLKATGGNAASGSAGSAGGMPSAVTGQNGLKTGAGGSGGDGGGGAGAGIGGRGGNGGAGGSGGAVRTAWDDEVDSAIAGDNGGNGGNGSSGMNGGSVYINEEVTVESHGGTSQGTTSGNGGGVPAEDKRVACVEGDADYYYATYCGGGGGGGKPGGAAHDFGGGGGGGNGGGGGGSGAIRYKKYWEDSILGPGGIRHVNGWGKGGADNGVTADKAKFKCKEDQNDAWDGTDYTGTTGGQGGACPAGQPQTGKDGTVFRGRPYIDETGTQRISESVCEIVTDQTSAFGTGWYVVMGGVTCSAIDVGAGCTANLILADGASLKTAGAGIRTGTGARLNVFRQSAGTGGLTTVDGGLGSGTRIYGGLFGMKVDSVCCADGYGAACNVDPATESDYPWIVLPADRIVTVRREWSLPADVTAVWTCGEGTKTNPVDGASLAVPKGTTHLKVIFVASDPAYAIVSGETVFLVEQANGDVTIPETTLVVAHRTVKYIDDRGQEKSTDNFSVITAETGPLANGWYLAEGALTRGSIKVKGDNVNLILADGALLRVTGGSNEAGIDVTRVGVATHDGLVDEPTTSWDPNKSLNIYVQQKGTGQLQAQGGPRGAGIGTGGSTREYYYSYELTRSGSITIYGGIVKATGGEKAAGIGGGCFHDSGAITIKGGEVMATGGKWAAGIGGGSRGWGTVTITGGKVTATAGERSAGIGGGQDSDEGSTVTITGGEVMAQGGKEGAGIGGHDANFRKSCTVTITGGKVTATAGIGGAGIGGNSGGKGGDVTITGGEVTAEGKGSGAGIGGGDGLDGGTVTINGGIVTATSTGSGAGIGGGREDGGADVTINGGTVTASSESGMGIGAGRPATGNPWPEMGSTQINGGNVKANSANARAIQIQPKNKSGQPVYRVTATLPGGTDATKQVTISGLSGYGTKDIYPLDGDRLYLYLPNNDYVFTANDALYAATVADAECTAESSYCRVTVAEDGLRYMTAVWTSGDETVSNAVENGFFIVQAGTPGVKVIFTPDEGYELKGEAVVSLGAVTGNVVFGKESGYCVPRAVGLHRDISYLDWDTENGRMAETMLASASGYEFVDEATRTLEDGKWYVVATDVVIDDGSPLAVNGSAHLILLDDASLTVSGVANGSSAIDIAAGGSLTICAQSGGTGWLSATGNGSGAGIGGEALTVNGGSIIATGGENGADIGCAAVTINGGNVKAGSITEQPQNAMKQDVYCVTVDVTGLGGDGLTIEGLEGCGIGTVMPIGGILYLYLPDGDYEFSVDDTDYVAGVAGEAMTATRCKTLPEDVPFEIFEDGLHFVESSGGAYINTRYHPTPNARFEVNQQTGVDVAISMAGSVCVFCGTGEGGRLQPQAMRLYSFRIYDLVDGEEKLVRDYVPFRTTDGSMIVGLYDKVTHALCINQGDGTLVLGRGGKKAVASNWFTGIAEGFWKDLGIGNVAIHEPCAEGAAILSRIEIDTAEGLFLRKFCDFEPDQEFADVLQYLPYDTLAAVKIDSDLLWTEDTEGRLREYFPDLADVLKELRDDGSGVRDDIVGGMYACVVADAAAKTTGMGAAFGFGVKGVEVWNQFTNLMSKVGEVVPGEGENSVCMNPGGTIWGLLGVGHELHLDLIEKDGKSLICGYSSKTVRQICRKDLAEGRTLASNGEFLGRAEPLLAGRDPNRTLRGFAYVTPDFITTVGNASDGMLKLLLNCCGLTDCWDFSIVETEGDRIFVTSRMSQSVSDFYELALWLGTDFAGNIVPEIGETVKFGRDYGPSKSAKGHFDFILGLIRIVRKALGINGLDYRYQDETAEGRSAAGIGNPSVAYATSMLMVKTESDPGAQATLFKMIAAGEAGTIGSKANAAERYLPADALAAVAFQPDYEAVMDVGRYLLDLAGRKDVANSLDVVCASGAGSPSCSAAFFGDMGLLLVSRIGTLESFKEMANSFGDVWGALQQDESDQNLWYYVRTEGNKGQQAMRLAFHETDGMLIYATSDGLLRQALAAGVDGVGRLCASEAFGRAMGTTLPAHNTLMYCAEGCVNSYAQWTADILSGSFSSDSVKRILGRDVLDLNACGYGVKGDDNVYCHYVRMRKDSHDALMTVAQAAFDAAGEGLQRVCPYDGNGKDARNFVSPFVNHVITKAQEGEGVTDNLIWSEARSGWTFVDNRTEVVSDWRTMDPGRPRTFEDGRSLVLSSRAVFSRHADADGGSGNLSIAFDTETSGQTCEGGELKQDENDDSLWILTPNAGRDTVMLGGLPDGAELQVKIGEYLIPGGVFKGFRNDNSSIFSLALNPEGVVGETPVRPVVGEFAIDAAGATLRFRTIGGLYYELIRAVGGFDLGRIENGIGLIGDGEEHSLQDDTKTGDPQGGVFYSLRVSLPGVQSGSGTAD